MHTSTTMKTAEFGFTTMSGPASFDEAFGWFSTDERVGVVVAEPGDGILAAPLVLAAIGAFYEKLRESGDDFYLYPDVFMFHMENLHGYHGWLDVWPERREVVVAPDPEALLGAVNDRGITRLIVPDAPPAAGTLMRESAESATRRIRTVLRVGGAEGPGSVSVARLASRAATSSEPLLGESLSVRLHRAAADPVTFTPIDVQDCLRILCGLGTTDRHFGMSEAYRDAHGVDAAADARHRYDVAADTA